ncbi:hypothetical protein [Bordetella hinzii]|uniref:Phage protein n=1 Tax=Bordetella hinzii OH87 BAL007II TaxID=1331262 RepID=A0ABR4R651_9BORD|nr:hypothetical protein [Bordetella hinzii]KCB25019.1 hypothetical protein L544_1056 [Bordetella hinzii OH87 BAL007II]QDJ43836.1 hypothetical protein CBR70_22420 [Bordetella hinzii]
MPTDQEIKKAAANGYARGYAAGKRRMHSGAIASERAFWERAFLASMATALQAQGWKFGDKPISTGDERMRLAGIWADRALAERKKRYD